MGSCKKALHRGLVLKSSNGGMKITDESGLSAKMLDFCESQTYANNKIKIAFASKLKDFYRKIVS